MNVAPSPESLRRAVPPVPQRSWLGWLADILLGKVTTLILTGIALAVGLATFLTLARGATMFT